MALIDKIFGKKAKSLTELTPAELRRQEIRIGNERDKIFKQIAKIADEKQKIFKQGADQKSPELRKALAMQFELKTQEQLMAARQLNTRSKELMTIGRVRMLKENRAKGAGVGRLNITEKDLSTITQWIDDDAVTQEIYQERLDSILNLGTEADKEALGRMGVGDTGQELMNIWADMDRGAIKQEEAFDEADKAVRDRSASKEI